MKRFTELIRDDSSVLIHKEKPSKKNKKKKRSHRENPEETDKTEYKNETQIEGDDLDIFINTVVMHGQTPKDTQKKPTKFKGPHHNGPFITGDFLSESTNKQTAINIRPPTEIITDDCNIAPDQIVTFVNQSAIPIENIMNIPILQPR